MGQSNSIMIEPIQYSDTNEWTNYMEWTNFKNFKKGEKYKLISQYCVLEGTFCYYLFGDEHGYQENCNAIFNEPIKNYHYYSFDTVEHYRFISKKEYNSKMRDKFNEKVLNVVLKKIVNDDFKWY